MTIRQHLSKLYRRSLHTFIFNDINAAIFYPKGYSKKINGKSIRVPFKFSWVYSSDYEPEKTDFIKQHCVEGDVVVDIGAHIGIFTNFLAEQVGASGKVYSFEPAPLTYKILQHTIDYNNLKGNVEAYQVAVSDKEDELTFYIYDNSKISSGNSFSDHNTAGQNPIPITVKTVSLDDFFKNKQAANISFIKIDAEGAELEILKGAEKTIKAHKPFITLEVHPKVFTPVDKVMNELYELIIAYGYSVEKNGMLLPKEDFCKNTNCFEVVLLPS